MSSKYPASVDTVLTKLNSASSPYQITNEVLDFVFGTPFCEAKIVHHNPSDIVIKDTSATPNIIPSNQYIIRQDPVRPWVYYIWRGAEVGDLWTIDYKTYGDENDAEDVNHLSDCVRSIETEVNSHKTKVNTHLIHEYCTVVGYANVHGKYNVAVHGNCAKVLSYNTTNNTIVIDTTLGFSAGDKVIVKRYNTTALQEVSITTVQTNVPESGQSTITIDPGVPVSSTWRYIIEPVGTGSYVSVEGTNNVCGSANSHAEGIECATSSTGAHAEGNRTYAKGTYSHSEGSETEAKGTAAHAEGYQSKSLSIYSHAEGYKTEARAQYSHSEGNNTVASGDSAHSEGRGTIAKFDYTHAEGYYTKAQSTTAHSEGSDTTACEGTVYTVLSHDQATKTLTLSSVTGLSVGTVVIIDGNSVRAIEATITNVSSPVITVDATMSSPVYVIKQGSITNACHAEGYTSGAFGKASHAEGFNTKATTTGAHSEGYSTKATGASAHSEGQSTLASGGQSHAEGNSCTASGSYSHAEGNATQATGTGSHAECDTCIASGNYSHASGLSNTAKYAQTVIGQYGTVSSASNTLYTSTNEVFLIGNGTSDSARGLAFKVLFNGSVYADGAYTGTGADYSEMFEWLDGNPEIEDRVGYFVTLDEDKVRKAIASDDYILGITSGTPAVLGDGAGLHWQGKYVLDEFGRVQYHEVIIPPVTEIIDGEEHIISPEGIELHPVYNPDWDPTIEYIPRQQRPEWSTVGLMGKLFVRDDGTCIINSYCRPNDDGVATIATSGYRVLKRVSPNIIQVLIK